MMNLRELQADPAAFRQHLRIDADGDSVRLGESLDDWQQSDFEALDSGWLAVTGQKQTEDSTLKRAWLERPRGHSKTSDLAVQVCWALFASKRKLTGYAAAADKDQAKLLKDAIQRLVRLNAWLSEILEFKQWQVGNRHTNSKLEILSADAPGSYGILPDFLIVDELAHWGRRDLWDSLLSASAKRANCVTVVITNAGFSQSWVWETREAVRKDESWYFSRLDGPQASWITEDRLQEQKRLLPAIAYNRLWLNQWTSGSGDALAEDDIQAALTLTSPLHEPENAWCYFGGLDLGLSRDKAALAVLGVHVGFMEQREKPQHLSSTKAALIDAGLADEPEPEYEESIVEGTGRLKLARLEVWSPEDSQTGKVDIEQIEEVIVQLDERFHLQVGADPWQAQYLIERLRKRGVPIEPVDFTGSNLKSMCSATLEAFNGNLDLFPDPLLISDLRNLKVVERSYGIRLDSPRGASGHGDTATALSICCHLASKITIAFHDYNRTIIAYA